MPPLHSDACSVGVIYLTELRGTLTSQCSLHRPSTKGLMKIKNKIDGWLEVCMAMNFSSAEAMIDSFQFSQVFHEEQHVMSFSSLEGSLCSSSDR
jgi:methylglyoxal synthase